MDTIQNLVGELEADDFLLIDQRVKYPRAYVLYVVNSSGASPDDDDLNRAYYIASMYGEVYVHEAHYQGEDTIVLEVYS